MILVINTATNPYLVGIYEGRDVKIAQLSEQTTDIGENLSMHIKSLCESAGISIREITAVGVVVGPGLYTGLRLGVSVAKSIGQLLSIPVYPINTLVALVYPFKSEDRVCFSVMPGRTDALNVGLFSCKDGDVRPLIDDTTMPITAFLKVIQRFNTKIDIIGAVPAPVEARIKHEKNSRYFASLIYGETLADLTHLLQTAGTESDPRFIKPVYSYQP